MDSAFNEISAITAVGLNGDVVVLSVSSDSESFAFDASNLPAKLTFKSCDLPRTPGLYLFKGSSLEEIVEENRTSMTYRGRFELISSYASPTNAVH